MNEYTVELEARPIYGHLSEERVERFFDVIELDGHFLGPVVSVGPNGLRVMGQVKADNVNEALGIGKASYRGAFKKAFDSDELEWTVNAVAPFTGQVESIPTPVV